MIPESYRPIETDTLMAVVSYGDPLREEPSTEEPTTREGEAARRWRVSGLQRRWRSLKRKTKNWPRLGWRWTARARLS
jgi:hypothetical protein